MLLFSTLSTALHAATVPDNWPQCLPQHPRIILTPTRLAQLRASLTQPDVAAVMELYRQEGELALKLPLVERKLEGRRLLTASREIERRCVLWAFLAVALDDQHFADAALRQMRYAVGFQDWNPSHFLDVAELSAGIGLAYDWLYPRMSAEDRTLIRDGLIHLALEQGQNGWWWTGTNNWNPVCNAGITVGALAVDEDAPELSRTIVQRALDGVQRVSASYAPDGAYAEGTMYWEYGTTFYVLLCDALDTSLGTTDNLEAMPGLLPSITFMEQMVAPSGRYVNFADCSATVRHPMACFMWLARRAGQPELADAEWQRVVADARQRLPRVQDATYGPLDRLSPLLMLWGRSTVQPVAPKLPLTWSARGLCPVAVGRTAWQPDAAYLVLKGGKDADNHAHMDAGSFIYEWGGVRWALDLGMQSYESLESLHIDIWNMKQNSQRWSVFRIGPESHNILRFDDGRQEVNGRATLRDVQAGPPFQATADLTPIYANDVTTAQRTLTLTQDGRAIVDDSWTLKHPVNTVAWQMMTAATVWVEGKQCVLESDGKRVVLRVLEPDAVRIETQRADELLQPYDAPNPGLTRIRVLLAGDPAHAQRLRIELVPQP